MSAVRPSDRPRPPVRPLPTRTHTRSRRRRRSPLSSFPERARERASSAVCRVVPEREQVDYDLVAAADNAEEKKSHFKRRDTFVRQRKDETDKRGNGRRTDSAPSSSSSSSSSLITDTTWHGNNRQHISPALPEFYRPRPRSPSLAPFPHLAPSGKIFLFGFRHVSLTHSLLSIPADRPTESLLPFSDSSETRHPPPLLRLRSFARQSALCSTIVACNEAYSESGGGGGGDRQTNRRNGTETEKGTKKRGITEQERRKEGRV